MTKDTRQAAISAVERNLDNIGERRQRLRLADGHHSGEARPPASSPGTAPASSDAAPAAMDLATASARATLRMAGVLDDFTGAVVGDITRAGQQIARLHQQASRPYIPDVPPAPPATSRARPDAIDIEAVEIVEGGTPPASTETSGQESSS